MAKGINQKLKLLYLIKIFSECTDENHCLSAQDLIERLQKYEVGAERKSIYSDIECLQDFGYDIVYNKSKVNGGYYLASRDFELPELKLLVDAVSASKFITPKKTKTLIQKIETLAGPFEGKELQRDIVAVNKIKAENEGIYIIVDALHTAIRNNSSISFVYSEWQSDKLLHPKHEGKKYIISPWALTWKDENYYLVAFDNEENKIKHFRVDKMSKVSQLQDKRKGREAFNQFDIIEYSNKNFGMFGGQSDTVTLECPEYLCGVIIDRFGKDIDIRKMENGKIRSRIHVAVSNQFYGWVTGIGPEMQIVSPSYIKNEYMLFLQSIIKSY